ncbi:MAG: S8 family serine peptidase [Planctomycetota bacterium]|nr:S8 family serine peptidase [Planctomycetota bacterium]
MTYPIRSIVATAFLSTAVVASAFAMSGPVTAPDKPVVTTNIIDAEIWIHQDMKRQYQDLPADSSLAQSFADVTNVHDPDHESCALYVAEQLSPERIAELRERQIEVNEWIWVPPVPGKHSLGFHIARVPYTRINELAVAPDVLRLMSIDHIGHPHNDLGGVRINVDDVNDGTDCVAADGSGIRIAIADSSFDLSHPDLPTAFEAFDVTDGTGPETWNSNVSSLVSGHGTHVAGTVAGSGANSNGQYAGAAPGAEICYYKIGNDTNASTTSSDQIESIQRALNRNCDIWTMSYGGTYGFRDGSTPVCQTIDAAVADGMTCFVSAGNSGTAQWHARIVLEPGEKAPMDITITAPDDENLAITSAISLVFRSATATAPQNVNMTCLNLNDPPAGPGENMWSYETNISPRDTRQHVFALTINLAAGDSKTYWMDVQNNSEETLTIHGYLSDYGLSEWASFVNSTNSGTLGTPGLADSTISVGAWTHRPGWTNYSGNGYEYPDLDDDTLAGFSSRGPRVDFEENNIMKPDIATPGAGTISARDSEAPKTNNANAEPYVIDDDGENLDGSGPATYYVMRGTSMSCPMTAGAAALMLQTYPGMSPDDIRTALQRTAESSCNPDNDQGYGLMDILRAVQTMDMEPTDVNENCVVNIDDLLLVIEDWGEANDYDGTFAHCAPTDVNNNGIVNIDDMLLVIEDWNETCD